MLNKLKQLLVSNDWVVPFVLVAIVTVIIVSFPLILYSDASSSWFSPFYNAGQLFSSWDSYNGPSKQSSNGLTSFILRLYYSLFSAINPSPMFVQKCAWILFFSVSIIIIYRFCRLKIKNKAFAAALTIFVLFNPIAQYFLWNKQHWTYYLTVAYFIGIIYSIAFFKTLRMRYALLISILWLIFGFGFDQPAYVASFFVLQMLLAVYFFAKSNSKLVFFKKYLSALFIFILINSIYFIPLAISGGATLDTNQSLYANADPLPILHNLQNLGSAYSLFFNSKGTGDIYLGGLISFIIIGLIIITTLWWTVKKVGKNGEDYEMYIVFLSALIIFMFFFKGLSMPFGHFSELVFSFKPMYIFRDFKDKFAIGISTAISFALLYSIKGSKSRAIGVLLCVISIISLGLFATHTWFPSKYKDSSNLSYFNEAKISKEGNFRILNLPLVDYSFFHTSKPYYEANNPMKNIFHHSVIFTTQNFSSKPVSQIKSSLIANELPESQFNQFLNNYSIKYIINNKNSLVREAEDPYGYKPAVIEQYASLSKIQSSKYFDLYEYKYYKPLITTNNNSKTIQLSTAKFQVLNKGVLNNVVFKDTYNSGWKLYAEKQQICTSKFCTTLQYLTDVKYLWQRPIDTVHVQSEDFGNKWYIDNEKGNVTAFFYPQAYTSLGIIVSTVSVLFVCIYYFKKRAFK